MYVYKLLTLHIHIDTSVTGISQFPRVRSISTLLIILKANIKLWPKFIKIKIYYEKYCSDKDVHRNFYRKSIVPHLLGLYVLHGTTSQIRLQDDSTVLT